MPTDGWGRARKRCLTRGPRGVVQAVGLLLSGAFTATCALAEPPSRPPEAKPARTENVSKPNSPAAASGGAVASAIKGKSTAANASLTSPVAAPPQRVAVNTVVPRSPTTLKPDHLDRTRSEASMSEPTVADAVANEPVARALRTIKNCLEQFESVADYTCKFYKRERIKGRLTPLHVMEMKARTQPKSIYLKFEQPYKGREAIYVEGRNEGRVLAHDVGFTKFLAGTLELEPTSARAMDENRHPITDAGIGALIDTVNRRWAVELSPDESILVFDENMTIGPRRCLVVESIHPRRREQFLFYKVRLFIDSELNLPIRFEGYDWPKEEGGPPELLEEYSYIDLKLNVGLGDVDFDITNHLYSFGRF
jgi:hypothetical protein